MPLQLTPNPRPAGNLSLAANQRARMSSVLSIDWGHVTDVAIDASQITGTFPIARISGLGTNVATALANTLNSASGVLSSPTVGTTPITSGTVNSVLYNNSSNVLSNTNNLASAVLVTSAGGLPSLSTTLPAGLNVWINKRLAKTSAYPVVNADKGQTIALGGTACYALTFAAASGYDADFMVAVVNEDSGRGKIIALNGLASFILWPLQSIIVLNQNSVWKVLGQSRWKPPASSTLNFYADFTNGTDTIGATDGLAAAAAFKTVERCFLNAADQIDFNAASQTQVICNMAANTTDTQGMHAPVHGMVGAQGGAAFQIQGATLAVTGAVNNGSGLVRLTMASTASYSTNNVVAVRNVGGSAGNGVWKITVIDATHIDLQGSTFSGAYTSGGTVSNGSKISTTGVDAIAVYFSSVLQIFDVTLQSDQNNLSALWGSKVYIGGIVFGGTPTGAHINQDGFSRVDFAASNGISGSAAYFLTQNTGVFNTAGAGLNIVSNITVTDFIFSSGSGSKCNFGSTTISLIGGSTVTGARFVVGSGATVVTGTFIGDLNYFPGNSAGTVANGGQYDSVMATTIAQGGTGASTASAALTNLGVSGTGVQTALGINVGTAGSVVVNGGALGTPSSGTASSLTGLPISTGLTGAGTGVLTALGVNVGTAGAFVTNGGALGTPSSGTVTNLTGTAGINITGTAPAGTLTGATLAAGVTASSLTSVGTLTGGATGAAFTIALSTSTITGTLPAARLPNPTSSTLGGIESYASVSHQWINAISTSGVPSSSQPALGDVSATVTNDNAATGGIGEYLDTSTGNNNASATATMTIAAPAVVTWTAHGFRVGGFTTAVKFTTTGALPTGIVSGTTYYAKAIDANTFNVATTADNALAGTFITTTGSQSGTHTADIRVSMATGVQQNIAAMSLAAGDYEVGGQMLKASGTTTTITFIAGNITTSSAAVDRTFGRRLSYQYGGLVIGANEFTVFDFAPTRFSLSGTTTIYLVADDTFATNTMASSGWLRARRAR